MGQKRRLVVIRHGDEPQDDRIALYCAMRGIELDVIKPFRGQALGEIDDTAIGSVICGSVAQTSFDAFLLPRHIGLYCGAPEATPAHLVQRVCGTGVEMIAQAADAIALKRAELALVVGAESMSRNPVAAYTHRGGFRLGAPVEFKDFLFEALMDTAVSCNMGDTAENLAKRNRISREEVDAFASRSFARAIEAQKSGFLAGEIAAVKNESFEREGMNARGVRLPSRDLVIEADTHIRPSPIEALAKIRPAFGGVQTGGNSSAIVDGAADKIEKQLRRYMRRLKGRSGGPQLAEPAADGVAVLDEEILYNGRYTLFSEPTEDAEPSDSPVIVAETRVDVPDATVSDAVMMLDLRNTNALLFRNSGTGAYNMVYRRGDGTIGWVEPQRAG